MLRQATPKTPITALYARLSKDDEQQGESLSIENQQAIRFVTAENKDCPYRLYYVRKGRWQLP